MNLATKTMPWMVASLLATTSIFGQNQNQGGCAPQPQVCKPAKCCTPQVPQEPKICAYNAPAEINVGCQGDIDFFASASFIYWQPSQDNMSIGLTDNNVLLTTTVPETIRGNFIEMDFDFHPGFKVGLGMNLQTDDWDGYAEYTRVHGTNSTSSNGPKVASGTPTIFPTFGSPYILGYASVFNTAYASYRNNLDFIDAEMGRTYYVGKSLIFRSAWGARGAWILQNVHARYNNTQRADTIDFSGLIYSTAGVMNVYQRSHSWAVGPRTGLMMDWMMNWGFRFFGSAYGDVLYTKYKLQDKSTFLPTLTDSGLGTVAGTAFSIITRDKKMALRAHMDLEMGLGWGGYFDNSNWHFDLSAAYGWQVFFDQNMFRLDTGSISTVGQSIVPQGNLYVQGLTLTARLDF